MSIHKRPDRGGKWQVKYKIAGHQRSRMFDRKQDAITFDADIKRRRALGARLAAELDREDITVLDYVRGPWRAHAATLAQPTRASTMGPDQAPDRAARRAADRDRRARGRCPPAALCSARCDVEHGPRGDRELSGILQIATEHGYIPANPARAVRNVPADHADEIRPLTPVELERLITSLAGRDRAIALLGGHLGMRPLEARLAPWDAFDGDTLTVGRSRTKAAARRARVIRVPAITARELKAWKLQSGGRGSDPIIGEMSPNAVKLWGRRKLPSGVRLYDLRHAHASACHYVTTLSVPEICRRLGHSEQTHFKHYAHVIDELSGQRYASLDELLDAAARAQLRFPQGSPAIGEASEKHARDARFPC